MTTKPCEPKREYSDVPVTLDARYLATHLGSTLTDALHEVAEKRPWGPIEYLAVWVHHYAQVKARKQAVSDFNITSPHQC